ncbi:MAG: SLC13 family permease [Phycisphaeraceae bacterium]|nr:MAG: SLC13 family permease [Phycisphaeraceae bacterium]
MPSILPDPLHPWAMLVLILGMVGALVSGRFGPDIVLMGVLTACVLLGFVDPTAAVHGFANHGLITVALLYVVASGMQETGATNMLVARLLGRPKSVLETQARLTIPVAGVSAFVNNTPIVAMFLPVLSGVARRGGFPAAKLFMPLSFASILGGVCTLIGTSTNIVVADLLNASDLTHEGKPLRFGMFTLTAVGLPIAAAGIVYILVLGRKLLPGDSNQSEETAGQREYMVAMRVSDDSALAGKTVEQANLRNLKGLFLARIDRLDATVLAVGPDEVLHAGDVLNFVGNLDSVVDLARMRGLLPITDEQAASQNRTKLRLVEAVVAASSTFIGRSIRDCGIRTRYEAVVVAVHRRGHRLQGKIGQIVLRAGDTLLLEAEADFVRKNRDSHDFYLVTERAESAAPRHDRAWAAIGILAMLVATISLGVPPLVASMVAAGLMIIARCCTGPQARANVDWQVLVTIGAAFGIGDAIDNTGIASIVARAVVDLATPLGPWAILTAIYCMTFIFASVMTHNAAAVIMFPLAMSISQQAGLNPLMVVVILAIAASCEFASPIGYQTNLMVMGPGGYRWIDYTRFGGPLTILAAIICIALAPLVYGMH